MPMTDPAKLKELVARTGIETLADLPAAWARLRPEKVAVRCASETLTFQELEAQSNKAANALLSAGLLPGDRIVFLDKNCIDFFPILFGAAKAGVALVTINFRLTPTEIAYILGDSEAKIAFVGAEFVAAARAAGDIISSPPAIVSISEATEDAPAFRDWIAASPTDAPAHQPRPESAAVQMYTSGTTGAPKGVELSHGALVSAAIEGIGIWPAMLREDAAVLAIMPLFHIAGANLCLACLFAGGRADIMREGTPAEVIRHVASERISILPMPAVFIQEILRMPDLADLDLSYLDTLLIAGSGIAVDLLRQAQDALGCGFALAYGMTECCGGVTYLGPDDCRPDAGPRLGSAGRPFGTKAIRIVDASGKELATGETGEIACRSDSVMTRYWKLEAATRKALRDGWYFSGDAGYIDEDGYLFVVDRIKDMIISGGENIYPAEIEQRLVAHPAVLEAAVIGLPDEKWGEAPYACILLTPGGSVTAPELEAFARETLAGFKVPRRYEFVTELPRNATGKVLKRVLRDERGGAVA